MTKSWLQLAITTWLLLAACSGTSDTAAASSAAVTSSPDATQVPGEVVDLVAFCGPANLFITSSQTRLVTAPDADVFVAIDRQLVELAELAPAEVAGDVASLQGGFSAIDTAYADVGYETGATISIPGQVQQDNAVAGERLERYLIATCELDSVRDEQILQIQEAFGLDDLGTAECLHAQLGDIANIESASLTPELMTTPVCGTSILGMLSGGETTSS